MMFFLVKFYSLCCLVIVCISTVTANEQSGFDFFEAKIRPILHDECIKCHGEKKQKGGFALHQKVLAFAGGDIGDAIVPGDPQKSLLIKAINRVDEDLKMPPKKELSKEQVSLLTKWIKMGAPWPEDQGRKTILPAAKRIDEVRKSHWSFKALNLPKINNPHQIDEIIKSKLKEKKLPFSKKASPRTLIRRVYFDLIGLPPSMNEVLAFEADPSFKAYQQMIEELLARPEYGERWGRHWLDVARYGDTKGAIIPAENINYPYAYTYRDYVIESFNRDLPFDQFVKEQLAADLIGDNKANSSKALAALGFVNVGPNYLSNHDRISDKIDVVTRGFLGLTVACARCHDHKSDPITIKDYYALYGVFNNSTKPKLEEFPIIGQVKDKSKRDEYDSQLKGIEKKLLDYKNERINEARIGLRRDIGFYISYHFNAFSGHKQKGVVKKEGSKNPLWDHAITRWKYILNRLHSEHKIMGPLSSLIKTSPDQLKSKLSEVRQMLKKNKYNTFLTKFLEIQFEKGNINNQLDLAKVYGEFFNNPKAWGAADSKSYKNIEVYLKTLPITIVDEDAMKYMTQSERTKYRKIENEKIQLASESEGAPHRAMVIYDKPGKMRGQHVFTRGDPARRAEPVKRRFVEVLQPMAGGQDFGEESSGRLALAESIVNPKNPMTAKVMVNRIWMWHFGKSLVRSPSDFGMLTPKPIQEDLLNRLAKSFIESGWSIKAMHRLIMMSETYQQSSEHHDLAHKVDPNNEYLWRFNRQRLSFEQMRDAILTLSGSLDSSMGGKSFLINEFIPKRTVYSKVDRNMIPDVFVNFDAGNLNSSIERRPVSSVPQQALYLLNDEFLLNQAMKMANRSDIQFLEGREWIRGLYHLAYLRDPKQEEIDKLLSFMHSKNIDLPRIKEYQWEYGFGYYDSKTKKIDKFNKFTYFSGRSWRMGKVYPHPKYRYVDLSGVGGHTGIPEYTSVRRWTSPISGDLTISGLLIHQREAGDGIYGIVRSNKKGLLGEWHSFNKKETETKTKLKVEKDEVIDFITYCGKGTNSDSYKWDPMLSIQTKEDKHVWQASEHFSGEKGKKLLDQREALAQIILMSNEFHFID